MTLQRNNITSIPETIGDLTNLWYLYLGNNQLSSLPETIENLTNLKELSLIGNNFNAAEIFRIKNLLPNCNVNF